MILEKPLHLFFALIFFTCPLIANDIDLSEVQETKKIELDQDKIDKINEYNENYIQFLELHAGWNQRLDLAQEKVDLAKLAYQTLVEQSTPAFEYFEHVKFDLESQVAHLEFLKTVEPVATNVQKEVQQEVVLQGWFNSTSEVTTISLDEKIDVQSMLINNLAEKIGVEEGKILSIKTSPGFIAVESDLASAQGVLHQAQTNLTTSERLKADFEWSLDLENENLEASNGRITEAKTRIIIIDNEELPSVELRLTRNQRRQDNLAEPIREAERKVKRISGQIEKTQAQISGLQIAINALGDGEEVQSKKEKLEAQKLEQEEKLSNQQNRLSEAEAERVDLSGQLDQLVENQNKFQRARRRLEREKLDQQSLIGQEEIDQISFNDAISNYEQLIAQEDANIEFYTLEIKRAEIQLSATQQAYENFNDTHILPIENIIGGLSGEKRIEERKRSNLQGWLGVLRRQNSNMAEASKAIAAQIEVIEAKEKEMIEAEATYSQVMIELGQKKAAANVRIQDYNRIVDEIEVATAQYNQLKDEVMNLEINFLGNEE